MNVVTANANKNIFDRLDFDIIKRIDGEYDVKELMGKLTNLYFNKLCISTTRQNLRAFHQIGTKNYLI